jgi:hypothetical protein
MIRPARIRKCVRIFTSDRNPAPRFGLKPSPDLQHSEYILRPFVRKSVNPFRCDTHVHCIDVQILSIGMAACLFPRLIRSIHDRIHIIPLMPTHAAVCPPVTLGSIIPGAALISILQGYDVCVYFGYFKCGSSNS